MTGRLRAGMTIVKSSPTAPASTWCHRSTLTLDKGGYPKNLHLSNGLLLAADSHAKVKERGDSAGWCAGAVVLANVNRHAANATDEASHLCGHPWCVRASHLVWEAPKANYARKKCNTHHVCSGCNLASNPCRHQPQCLDMHECTCDWHQM